MKTFRHLPLLATLLAAALASSGCMQPVEASAVTPVAKTEAEAPAPHRCRSGASQTTQRGCKPAGALARN